MTDEEADKLQPGDRLYVIAEDYDGRTFTEATMQMRIFMRHPSVKFRKLESSGRLARVISVAKDDDLVPYVVYSEALHLSPRAACVDYLRSRKVNIDWGWGMMQKTVDNDLYWGDDDESRTVRDAQVRRYRLRRRRRRQ